LLEGTMGMRPLFSASVARVAGVGVIGCALLSAAPVGAQTRFEAIAQSAIAGVPALQIVTIRDHVLNACYVVFVNEPARPSGSAVATELPDVQAAVTARDERLADLLRTFDQDRSVFAGTISPNPFKYQWQADIAQQNLAWTVLARAFGRIEQRLDRLADAARIAIAVVPAACAPVATSRTP
jgi:hypothetical protein